MCLSNSGFSGAAWPCAVAVVGSEPRGEGVDLGGVHVVEAGPLGGAGAPPTGSAGEPHPAGRRRLRAVVGCGYSMTWHRPGMGWCLGVMPRRTLDRPGWGWWRGPYAPRAYGGKSGDPAGPGRAGPGWGGICRGWSSARPVGRGAAACWRARRRRRVVFFGRRTAVTVPSTVVRMVRVPVVRSVVVWVWASRPRETIRRAAAWSRSRDRWQPGQCAQAQPRSPSRSGAGWWPSGPRQRGQRAEVPRAGTVTTARPAFAARCRIASARVPRTCPDSRALPLAFAAGLQGGEVLQVDHARAECGGSGRRPSGPPPRPAPGSGGGCGHTPAHAPPEAPRPCPAARPRPGAGSRARPPARGSGRVGWRGVRGGGAAGAVSR